MGINPIQYRAWKGERTALNLRVYVILKSIFRHGLTSVGVKALLIVAFLLVYAFQFVSLMLFGHETLDAEEMNSNFNAAGLALFAMLLAAVITSDLISEDLSNRSFVLYFSRAVKTRDYLIGKAGGAILIMSLLCFLPPVLLAVASILTQSSGDYWSSNRVTVVCSRLDVRTGPSDRHQRRRTLRNHCIVDHLPHSGTVLEGA
jgi:ABC-type transport system involved in multi-copper enzyme maturation permease subunit